jgi:hypothetical protein
VLRAVNSIQESFFGLEMSDGSDGNRGRPAGGGVDDEEPPAFASSARFATINGVPADNETCVHL